MADTGDIELEVMDGAKDEGFQTRVFCQKGREGPYQRFGRIADEITVVDKFKEMASAKYQKELREQPKELTRVILISLLRTSIF